MKNSEFTLLLAERFFDAGMEEQSFIELFRAEFQLDEEREAAAYKLKNFNKKVVEEA